MQTATMNNVDAQTDVTTRIDESQAKQEQTILQSMLKAIEQTELAAKLERLEAVVRSRR